MNSHQLDDATAQYILETRKCFEDLRQVTAQIAGVLVLAAAGGKSATPDHPMLEAAAELHREALDQLRAVCPTERAREHHLCLTRAAQALSNALATARVGGQRMEVTPILLPVRAAYAHLQRAADTLPGFEMVAFEQGCCATQRHTPQNGALVAARPGILPSGIEDRDRPFAGLGL
jgi:hypothetical protein